MERQRYLDFLDPIHIVWRKGTVDDPYLDRVEIVPVINQRVILSEIPDKLNKVKIPFLKEVNYTQYINNYLKEDEYYVDYSNGIIVFHNSQEEKTMSLEYKGRGLIMYPSSRIYHADENGDIDKTLADIANDLLDRLKELEEENSDLTGLKIELTKAIDDANINSDYLLSVIEEAQLSIQLVENAYKTTQIVYRPYVDTYDDIAIEYPYPNIGWAVQVYNTGIRYRWDGIDWIPIDILGGGMSNANEFIDGLMSNEDYIKLNDINKDVDTRVIVFVIPGEVLAGIQSPHIAFPFDGIIEKIDASLSKKGTSETVVRVEKSNDYSIWNTITENHVQINSQEHFDNGLHTIIDDEVIAGDIFRLYIPLSGDVSNLTLNIKIKI